MLLTLLKFFVRQAFISFSSFDFRTFYGLFVCVSVCVVRCVVSVIIIVAYTVADAVVVFSS